MRCLSPRPLSLVPRRLLKQKTAHLPKNYLARWLSVGKTGRQAAPDPFHPGLGSPGLPFQRRYIDWLTRSSSRGEEDVSAALEGLAEVDL